MFLLSIDKIDRFLIDNRHQMQSTSIKFNEMGKNYLELNDKLEQIKQNLTTLPEINVDYCVSRLSN